MAPIQAATLPDLVVPATCGMQLKGGDSTDGDLEHIAGMGVAVVRRGFIWDGIEKTTGVYDFTATDQFMQMARAHHLRVLGCIAFASKLYAPVRTDEGRQAYARYAAALAAHYHDDAVIWELWNEPNTMTFWGKHGGKGNTEQYAGEYTALVKAAVPAMRAADPACTIVAGSVSGLWSESFKWTGFCFAQGILQTGIDGWSVHPYSPRYPEDYPEAYATVRELMAKHGAPREFPILNSERGFPIAKAEGYAGSDPVMARQHQAWHLVRQCLMDLCCGVRLSNWYEWKGKDFGIFDQDQPTPAFQAYRVMIAQLRGYRLDRRIPAASPRDVVLAFTGPGKERKLVAWTSPPPDGKPDQAQPHAIAIPVEGAGAVDVVGLDGEAGAGRIADGVLTLTVTGAPQYAALRAGP
jgi:hypothetical protein